MMFFVPYIMHDVIVSSAAIIGIPSYIVDGFIGMIFLSITMLLIAFLSGRKVHS